MRTLFAVALLAAQMVAQTASYPGSIPTAADLLVAYDRAATTLTSSINASTLSIPVASGAVFPLGANQATLITVDSEIIKICSRSGNTLTACADGRGYAGTTAASHVSGRAVDGRQSAWYHNRLRAEVQALASAQRVSVKAYGAVGDNSTDDTAAIQAAIDGNSGKAIYLPCGTYRTTASINISGSDTWIVGDYLCTVINPDFDSGKTLNFDAGTGTGSRNGVANLAIIGSTQQAPSNRYGIYLYGQNTFTAQNIFSYYQTYHVWFASDFNVKLLNITTGGGRNGIGKGIVQAGGAEVYIEDCFVGGATGAEPDIGIHIASTAGSYIRHTGVINHRYGMMLGSSVGTAKFIFMNTVALDTNIKAGLVLQPDGSSNKVLEVHGTDMWLCSNGENGLSSEPLNGGAVDGVYLTLARAMNNGYNGLNLASGTSNFGCIPCRAGGNSAVWGGGLNTLSTDSTGLKAWTGTPDPATQNGAFTSAVIGKTITIGVATRTISSLEVLSAQTTMPGGAILPAGTIVATLSSAVTGNLSGASWSVGEADVYHGAYVSSNLNNIQFVGGRYGQHGGFPNTQNAGIVFNGGTSTHVQIIGVDATGNLSDSILDGTSATADKQIWGNLPATTNFVPSCSGAASGTICKDGSNFVKVAP